MRFSGSRSAAFRRIFSTWGDASSSRASAAAVRSRRSIADVDVAAAWAWEGRQGRRMSDAAWRDEGRERRERRDARPRGHARGTHTAASSSASTPSTSSHILENRVIATRARGSLGGAKTRAGFTPA